MARKSGFVRRNNVMRRDTAWFFVTPVVTAIAGSTAVLISTFNAAALALRPFTIVRTRLGGWYGSDQDAATEEYGAAYGSCIVSDQASAIGVTAIPTPITDLGSDAWFLHMIWGGRFEFNDATGFGDVGQVISVDSKAMRKVDIGFDLVSVAEASLGTGSRINLGGRMLVKLH